MMFEIIKKLISCENAGAALVIGSGWGAVAGISASCPGFRFLGITLIVIGVAQLIVGVVGKNNPEFAKEIAYGCYTPLSLTALGLGMFAIAVSTGGSGESIPGRSYKVYHLNSFSNWMQHKVNDNAYNWQSYYKKAIVDANVCTKFSKQYEFDTLDVIHTTNLSPFEVSLHALFTGLAYGVGIRDFRDNREHRWKRGIHPGEILQGLPFRLFLRSNWMQHKVNNAHNWQTYYKTAIVDANMCTNFFHDYEFHNLDALHSRKLTPFESSCCMPPEDCGFNYKNATVWIEPEKGGGNYTNLDCNRWDNDPNTLCYDCESCKAAFLQDVTTHYFYSGIAIYSPIIPGLLLLLCCSCACCTMAGLGAIFVGIRAIFVGIGAIFVFIFDGLCTMFARLGTMFSGRNSSDDDNNTSPLIA